MHPHAAPPGALVVGGAHVSLGLARSLGRRGIPVWLLAQHPLPRFSRYVRRCFAWPGADHPRALDVILDILARHDLAGWVLMATGDEDMRLVARHRAELSAHLHVATPDWETARWTFDKRLTYRRAAALALPTPWTAEPQALADIERLECPFPVILKPAYRRGGDAFGAAKAWKADDRASLVALYHRAVALREEEAVIVQEWIPGGGEAQFSCAGLWRDGEPVALMTARRSRQYPVDFGRSSTFVESIEQEEVADLACRLLASLRYTGVAEVEFKYDARDGRFKLLDVNGRFWTWCGLGSLAGTDFPHLAWRQARGETITPCRARPGVAWMHGRCDLPAAWREMRRRRLTMRDYLAGFRKPLVFAAFAPDDPLPAFMEIPVAAFHRWMSRPAAARQGRWRGRPAPAK